MATYNLTADELLLVYLTYIARDEEGGHTEFFSKWFNNGGNERLRSLFNSLKEKGIIHKNYNAVRYNPNEIEFNKTILKGIVKSSCKFGQELFNAYPPFMAIQGKFVPLKDISKRFASLDDFYFFYSTQIGHQEEKHREVMEILEWAKEHEMINFGILSFVISNQWNMLKELRDNPESTTTVSSILTIDE